MKKTILTLATGLAVTAFANAALTDASTPWGAVTSKAAEQNFVDYIGNTVNTGYAHLGQNDRSPSEKGEGSVGALTFALEDISGQDNFVNLIYGGGSTNHVREFGFDVSFGGMSAEVVLTAPLAGKTAGNIPGNPDTNIGRVFSMSLKQIVALVNGAEADAVAGVTIDFFARKTGGGAGGLVGKKVLASEGVAVFDYTPFVDADPYAGGVTALPGSQQITQVPGGFPEGITRVWGWEDQISLGGANPAGYMLDGVDSDFNDFIMTLAITNRPITTSVPEPSTYGLIGAAALIGLIARRRMKAQKN